MSDNQSPQSPLELALRAMIREKGRDVYKNTTKVTQYLREQQVPLTQIRHVELILTDSALVRYLEQMNESLSAVECNNILISAEGTGLSERTIRVTVEALLGAMGVPQVLEHVDRGSAARGIERGLYVPPREYEAHLNEMEKKLGEGEELSKDEYTLLDQFVQAGVPKAYRLLGQVCLRSSRREQVALGLQHLEYAAQRGEAEAAALLADYHAPRAGRKAHAFYTRPGALAMDDERKENFRMLKKKHRGRMVQLALLACVFLVVQAVIWLLPVSPITGPHDQARKVCTWINVLNAAWLAGRYVLDPYRDLRAETIPMLLSMLAYALTVI